MLKTLKERTWKLRLNILKPINSDIVRNKFLIKYWDIFLYFPGNDKNNNKLKNYPIQLNKTLNLFEG
jgi:hypothetical protein